MTNKIKLRKGKKEKAEVSLEEKFYVASQYQLMWRKFRKHKLAIVGGIILFVFYLGAILCEFVSPYDIFERYTDYLYAPPQRIRFFDEEGFHLRPFVYKMKLEMDPITWERIYKIDRTKKFPLYFFTHGPKYKFWNLFKGDLHLFGVKEGTIFLLGTDGLGRDMFSRIIYASRISLSIGLIGVFLSFALGLTIGGASGYYGGYLDNIIQRVIEFLRSMPTLPLWMALAAALPPHWSPIKIYFGITIILAIIGWTGLARVVRGKLLTLREEDFAMAAKIAGTSDWRIITNHLLPSFLSYIIVRMTLTVPGMILAETSLSFLGIGLRPPVVSWGTLLSNAQNVHSVALYPWLLLPGVFVIVVILAFNFVGDGLRDAADPYK